MNLKINMRKNFTKELALSAVFIYSAASAQTLLHYWNFNNSVSEQAITTPSKSVVPGASLTAKAGGISKIDFTGGTKQNFDVDNLNARNGDPAGTHLRFNDPIGGALEFALPTTAYSNIIVKFATRRSGSGAGIQKWSYSTNGTDFTAFKTVTPNDANPELITLDFSNVANVANNPDFKLKVEFEAGTGGTVGNNRFDNFTVDAGAAQVPPSVSLAKNMVVVNEKSGSAKVVINVTEPADGSIDLVLKPSSFNTADAQDFTFTSQTVKLVPGQTQYTVNIPVSDDAEMEQQAEYFTVELQNAVNAKITGDPLATVYILDDDTKAPVPSQQVKLNYLGSFDPSGSQNSSVEIIAYDPATRRIFAISAVTDVLDIIDFSNPSAPSLIKTIDMKPYGGITSVAVKNGMVTVASPNTDPQQNGSVVFFDTNGNFLKQFTVGALPDMITFSPDGKFVMTANEGEPNDAYTTDPEGSVSIIDISGGIQNLSQNNVTTLDFSAFNAQQSALIAAGIRKLKNTSTLSQDLEPEYITITADSKRAYVVLQENNAIAEINLTSKNIVRLWALGKKDMSLPGNGFDASDNNGEILIANWPVKSFYMPDGIQTYRVNGTDYIVTANEGDEKELKGLNERTTVGAADYTLDPAQFPQAAMLKKAHNLGRFRVTNLNGNTDGDSDFEELNSNGTRSFSIFNADTGKLVYDSGDSFERYTADKFPAIFNSDHEENKLKSRSRAKGPEPEGIALAKIGTQTFAFITLERIGGVMVYDITNPEGPVFSDYQNPRSTTAYAGDHGPEGVTYISAGDSPDGKAYVTVANEISGTISIYELDTQAVLGTKDNAYKSTFNVFPNPVNQASALYFNRAADYELYDMSGKFIRKDKKALQIDTNTLTKGLYIIKTSEGGTQKFLVK